MITIDYLQNHPEFIETVTQWIYDEWCHKVMDRASVLQDVRGRLHDDRIPLTLVAIAGEECVGTISIFEYDLDLRHDLTPWLAALYIHPDYRNQGIGSALIAELLIVARRLGIPKLYLHTETASPYYARKGWTFLFQTINDRAEETDVFEKYL